MMDEPRSWRAALGSASRDVIGFAGVALISYGSWLVYPPAGFIVCGALLMAAVVLGAKRGG